MSAVLYFFDMNEKQETKEEGEVNNRDTSREPLFGALLFGGMILLVAAALGLIGWGVYSGWSIHQGAAALPSIGSLATEETTPEGSVMTEKKDESVVKTEETSSGTALTAEELKKSKTTDIKVVNGGAAKGSATVVAELLKKNGYTKVSVGNTLGDYTGVVVYFAAPQEKDALALKDALLKNYPKAEVKPAIKENKETTQAILTVILGK